ncbi:MAG TPA: hypothetical protein VFD02_01240 [Syntrophomonadaceae bacterium]|nr:hypothetical protein [Syntrophomonadaceae bacterium]
MLLTKAWEMYRENWFLYFKLTFLPILVLGILKAVIVYLTFSFAHMDSGNKDLMKIVLVLLNLLWWLGHLFWIVPLIYALDSSVASKVNLRTAFASIFNNFHRSATLAGIVMSIYLLYLIPTYINVAFPLVIVLLLATVFILVWYALFIPIWFLEDKSWRESLASCQVLIKGKRVSFVLELVVIYVIFTVFKFLLNFIIGWPAQKLVGLNMISMNIALYFLVIFMTLMQIILASFVIVWLYCYYRDLKAASLSVVERVEN